MFEHKYEEFLLLINIKYIYFIKMMTIFLYGYVK